jgi:hypothetical protein
MPQQPIAQRSSLGIGMQVRLLNRLYAKKRERLRTSIASSEQKAPAPVEAAAPAAPPPQPSDDRSLDELMAFIEQGSGGKLAGGGSSSSKKKGGGKKAKHGPAAGSSNGATPACEPGGSQHKQGQTPDVQRSQQGDQHQGNDLGRGGSGGLLAGMSVDELFPEDGFDDEGEQATLGRPGAVGGGAA